jgi:hypothetical protein
MPGPTEHCTEYTVNYKKGTDLFSETTYVKKINLPPFSRTFQKDLEEKSLPGYVVHPGDVKLPLGPGATALPFANF